MGALFELVHAKIEYEDENDHEYDFSPMEVRAIWDYAKKRKCYSNTPNALT